MSTEDDDGARWPAILADVEDLLCPALSLDPWERSLYYHLLRHTRAIDRDAALFAVAPLSRATGISDFKVREVLRSLHRKGCVRIEDRSRQGHYVAVLIPSEVAGLPGRPSTSLAPVDLEAVDFFSERRLVDALFRREGGACFYCLKQLVKETCELDHVVAQASVSDHSYRNVVVSCHSCNKAKGEQAAGDYLRSLYRRGVLNEQELHGRLTTLAELQAGRLKPELLDGAG